MPIHDLSVTEKRQQMQTFVEFFVREFMAELNYLEETARGNIPERANASLALAFNVACALVSLAPVPGAVIGFVALPHVLTTVVKLGQATMETEWGQQVLSIASAYIDGGIQGDIEVLQGDIGGDYQVDNQTPIDHESLSVLAKWLGYQLARRYEQALTERLSTQPDEALVSLARVGARRCLAFIGENPLPSQDRRVCVEHLLSGVLIGGSTPWYHRPLAWLKKEVRLTGRDEAKTLTFTAEKLYRNGAWVNMAPDSPCWVHQQTEWIKARTLFNSAPHPLEGAPTYGYVLGDVASRSLDGDASEAPDCIAWQQRRLQQPVSKDEITAYLASEAVLQARQEQRCATQTFAEFMHAHKPGFPLEAEAVFSGNLSDLVFSAGNFLGVDFSGSQFSGDFTHTDFTEAKLYACIFSDLSSQVGAHINFAQAEMGFSSLKNAQLANATVNFTQADLTCANLSGAQFGAVVHKGTRWHKAILKGMNSEGIFQAQAAQVKELIQTQVIQRQQLEQLNEALQQLEARMQPLIEQQQEGSDQRAQLEALLVAQTNRLQFEAYAAEKFEQLAQKHSEHAQEITQLKALVNAMEQAAIKDRTDFQSRCHEVIEAFFQQSQQQQTLDPRELEEIVRRQVVSCTETYIATSFAKKDKPPLPDNLLVSFCDIRVQKKLMDSASGAIYLGQWLTQVVRIVSADDCYSDEDRQAFIRQMQTLNRLRAPAIIQFYGACIEKTRLCYLTEVVEQNLEERLADFSLEQRWQMVRRLASGLAELHRLNVAHGDIQLKSVGLDQHQEVKWVDFHFVKWISSASMGTIKTLGDTLLWQAPELWSAEYGRERLGVESDMYSFGLLLWTLLTGKTPYSQFGNNITHLINEVKSGYRESIPSDWPDALRDLLTQCWDDNPMLRPKISDIIRTLASIPDYQLLSPDTIYDYAVVAQRENDLEKAYQWYQYAYERGCIKGLTNMGLFKLTGLGGQMVDKAAAIRDLEEAAKHNHGRAMFNLARIYEKGDTPSGQKDLHSALSWYQKAVEQEPDNTDYQTKVIKISAYVT